MTAEVDTLRFLLARVRRASAPDPDLDRAIDRAIGPREDEALPDAPAYTASINEAWDLALRVGPLRTQREDWIGDAYAALDADATPGVDHVARLLLAALLAALIAEARRTEV